MKDFKLFLDKALQLPVEEDADGIFLGKLKAGKTKKFKYYIYNPSVFPYEEIKYDFNVANIFVIEAPKELREKASAPFIIEWKPKVNIEKGLKTILEIDFYKAIKG